MAIETIAIITSAISTAFIAIFSYKSNQISNAMKKISQENQELTNKINAQNKIQSNKVNSLFWALIFSNILVDRANRKEKLGFIIKLFGWENIKNDININKDDLASVANANCSKYLDNILNSK